MSNGTTEETVEIFSKALEFDSLHEREAFVARTCGDRPRLLAEIRGLLRAQSQLDQETHFLETPVGRLADVFENQPSDPHAEEAPPDAQIGPYRLIERLGEGGFGVVWRAAQSSPVQREVAIKLIKLGMDTRSVLARFDLEKRSLERMQHPNIAKVLDAGVHEARPYFVMELIHGQRLTDHCDARRLSVAERVRLCVQVCHGIQHAHQKGVLHRDIKPGNVLVAVEGGDPTPKIIDFGVAKSLSEATSDASSGNSTHGGVVGTPNYMSPEQRAGGNEDVDTRSDIFGLGMLLYELLAGCLPFDTPPAHSGDASHLETPRPSVRAASHDGAIAAAKNRGVDVRRLSRSLRGDLDWIVLKATAPEKPKRYETAIALALDLQRYLDGRPVTATPPSTAYYFGKFARRHALVLGSIALIVALSIPAAVFSWIENARFRRLREERIAEESLMVEQSIEDGQYGKAVGEQRRLTELRSSRGGERFLWLQSRSRLGDLLARTGAYEDAIAILQLTKKQLVDAGEGAEAELQRTQERLLWAQAAQHVRSQGRTQDQGSKDSNAPPPALSDWKACAEARAREGRVTPTDAVVLAWAQMYDQERVRGEATLKAPVLRRASDIRAWAILADVGNKDWATVLAFRVSLPNFRPPPEAPNWFIGEVAPSTAAAGSAAQALIAKTGVAESPDGGLAYILGWIEAQSGHWDAAAEQFLRSKNQSPREPRHWIAAIAALCEIERNEHAIDIATAASLMFEGRRHSSDLIVACCAPPVSGPHSGAILRLAMRAYFEEPTLQNQLAVELAAMRAGVIPQDSPWLEQPPEELPSDPLMLSIAFLSCARRGQGDAAAKYAALLKQGLGSYAKVDPVRASLARTLDRQARETLRGVAAP